MVHLPQILRFILFSHNPAAPTSGMGISKFVEAEAFWTYDLKSNIFADIFKSSYNEQIGAYFFTLVYVHTWVVLCIRGNRK